MGPKKRPIESNVAAWDGVVQADRRVPVLSAAAGRSNLAIDLLDPRKKREFHGRWTQLGRRC
jgi:hypothetical protein